jgi:hypothetical protein
MMLLRSVESLTGSLVRGFLSLIGPLEEILGLYPAPLLLFSFWTESEGFLCCTAAMMFSFSTGLEARGLPTID